MATTTTTTTPDTMPPMAPPENLCGETAFEVAVIGVYLVRRRQVRG